ncbi:molybdopterin-dependent oxidoreductase [Chloroflexota bacterium]
MLRNVNAERIVYTSCGQNGCYGQCILKVHVKNRMIIAIEADDSINANNPREDLDDKAYRQGMIQARACVRGRGWRKIVYDRNRLLYPMKRVGKRGSGQWQRISWDEALDTIAGKMKEAVEKYGPYSVSDIYPGVFGRPRLPITPWVDFGFSGWGMSSFSGHELAQLLTTGYDYVDGLIMGTEFDGNEAPDFLNAKAIVMWGWDPAITCFEITYYLMLAKERGIPIIVIDPVYSVSAEAYGSQWIPIRPGTDAAALLAVAQVLFAENIYDHNFVARFVEAEGFEEFRFYVMGESDGVPKAPEWAEEICGVPADTLRGLARLIAKEKPTFFRLNWSVARKLYGETAARLGMFIPAMTGNLGFPGTFSGGAGACFPYHDLPFPVVDWWRSSPTYHAPIAMHGRKLADAILLKEDLEAGQLTEDEYRRHIGAPPEAPLTDSHVVSIGGAGPGGASSINGLADINKQLRALEKIDFTFTLTTNLRHHMTQMADMILPAAEPFFETDRGFMPNAHSYMSNYFLCCFKAVDPPGEARPTEWVWLELARRFGRAAAFNGRLANAPYEQWDEVYEEAFREAYETWAARDDVKVLVPEIPSWEEFKQHPVIRVPLGEAYYPFKEQIEGKKPFDTPSGKIEFVPKELRDPEFPQKSFRGRCFGGSIPTQFPAVPEWKIPPDSLLSEKARTYPLYVVTPHSQFRQHSTQDNNPWFRDECRHAVWLSVADAKARRVKDGDLVQVYNDKGEMILPAYVTSRVVPGTVVVRFGAWYTPSKVKSDRMPYGIDQRGASNFLTHDDLYPWVVGALNCGNLVQVKKASESVQGGF